MFRYQITIQTHIEVEAEDKADAYEVAKEWAEAVEEGDGHWVQGLASTDVVRCRMVIHGCNQLHEVPARRVLVGVR